MPFDINEIRERMETSTRQLTAARKSCQALKTSLDVSKSHQVNVTEATELAQKVAQAVQQQAHNQIAGVVSRCLEAVFPEAYEFIIHFERKRGRTQARLAFVRDGLELDPMDASGGGVVDVASFALRLSCLILHKPPLRRIMVMDEPFRFVSEEYRERIRKLLHELSNEMNVQFILVTHISELKTGTIVELS